jgi:hypothetical protein
VRISAGSENVPVVKTHPNVVSGLRSN